MALIDDPKVQTLVDKAVAQVKKQAAQALKAQHRAFVTQIKEHGKQTAAELKSLGEKERVVFVNKYTQELVGGVPPLNTAAFEQAA